MDIESRRAPSPTLSIKLNNAASNDPCEICGARTDPETGPELFLDETWGLVCYECGDKYAPELTECLLAYRRWLATDPF